MRSLLVVGPFALGLLLAAPALAQERPLGVGGQVGTPTGVTLRLATGAQRFDLAAGWDLADADLFVQGHLLLDERPLPGTDLRWFYGPGLFLGNEGGEAALGFSFNVGLAYFTGPVEVFGQFTPRLRLLAETDFDLGAAVGLRYYP